MKVNQAQLARHVGLPANANESMIRARLAGLETEKEIRAAQTVLGRATGTATASRLGAGIVQAASDAELRSYAASPLSAADREAVAGEMSHRDYLGRYFPAAARAAGYEPSRVDMSARSGDPVIGISG